LQLFNNCRVLNRIKEYY